MECRTPLDIKVEAPPPPPGQSQSSTPESHHKENQPQHARMSPALQRRQQAVQSRYGRHPPDITPPKPPVQPMIKQRLPLPKNAVLLSLIQASEPARRRVTVETPPEVHPKTSRELSTECFSSIATSSKSAPPTPKTGSISSAPGTPSLLPKFSKASPLFVDTGLTAPSSSSEYLIDDDDVEEHQIRVGTYLEGGPCGTYAVAVKTGLLVYPTLFEHALPNTVGSNSKDVNASLSQQPAEQPDQWKRDVDELVKSSYRKKQQQMKQQECIEVKMPARTQSSRISPTLFDGDEWHVEASIGDDGKQSNIGMRLSVSLSHESGENRDDVIPESMSSSFSHDEPNDDSTLNRSLPLTHAATFSRQQSVPISTPCSKKEACDDFDRPLIRLKYGDRVQVVSMDSKGWVKLARGYGYIRLQSGKQLVKGE